MAQRTSKGRRADKFAWGPKDLEMVFMPEGVGLSLPNELEEQTMLLDLLTSVSWPEQLGRAALLAEQFQRDYPDNGVVIHALFDATNRVQALIDKFA